MSSSTHSRSFASKTSEKTSQRKLLDIQQSGSTLSEKKLSMSHSSIFEKKSTPFKVSDRKSNPDRASQLHLHRTHWNRNGDAKPDRSTSEGHVHHSRRSQSVQLNHARIKYENTYKLGPDVRFSSYEVTKLAQEILDGELADVTYDANRCKELSQSIVSEILTAVKRLGVERYKFVTVVSIGSLQERPGTHFSSRCLWDLATDNFASVTFTSESLFAVATVFALYQE